MGRCIEQLWAAWRAPDQDWDEARRDVEIALANFAAAIRHYIGRQATSAGVVHEMTR
jgi:hypothetical protein